MHLTFVGTGLRLSATTLLLLNAHLTEGGYFYTHKDTKGQDYDHDGAIKKFIEVPSNSCRD